MVKIILLISLFIAFDILGESAAEVQKIFKQEALVRQKHNIEIDELFIKAQKKLQNLKYIEANNHLIEAVLKLPLLKISENKLEIKLRKLKDYNSKVYLTWVENIIVNKKVTLESLSFALEHLEKALSLSSLYTEKINILRKRINLLRKKKFYQVAENIDGIIGLKSTLDANSNGVARRKYLTSIRFERGKVYFDERDYVSAIDEFEALLILDPYDSRAISYLERCYNKIAAHGFARRELTYAQIGASSRWKWASGLKVEDKLNELHKIKTVVKKHTIVERLKKRLDINLKAFQITNASVEDALERLRVLSQQQDKGGIGINFVIRNLEFKKRRAVSDDSSADDNDPFADDNQEADEIDGVKNDYLKIEDRKISINLQNIPVREVLRYIVSIAKLKYKIEEFAVLITDKEDPGDDFSTDFFPVSANFLEIIEENADEDEDENGIKKYFQSLGVNFSPKSQIRYISAVNRLVVTNTQENLRRVEELLTQLNVAPKQILIESKFVDIAQNDLDEVGFQWFFELRAGDGLRSDLPTEDFITLSSNGDDNFSVRESGVRDLTDPTLVIRNSTDLNNNPFTATQGSISNLRQEQLRITTFLDKVRYDTLIRLLDQKDSTNILSAPRVSTINGGTAILRVVEERFFPESWEPPEVTNVQSITVITPSTPQFAPPRDIGVVLEVTPQIDADGYSIQLQVLSEVIEFLSYDVSFNENSQIQGQNVVIRYDVPIISVRRLETNILLYDGETVTLGGLIREEITGLEDKVPFLSSIPLIGRLFVSKSIVSQKRNFLVFVSVRLVSPSGVSIRPSKIRGLPNFKQL